jgi:hypothetical protein
MCFVMRSGAVVIVGLNYDLIVVGYCDVDVYLNDIVADDIGSCIRI